MLCLVRYGQDPGDQTRDGHRAQGEVLSKPLAASPDFSHALQERARRQRRVQVEQQATAVGVPVSSSLEPSCASPSNALSVFFSVYNKRRSEQLVNLLISSQS